jgi:hypothetical protein
MNALLRTVGPAAAGSVVIAVLVAVLTVSTLLPLTVLMPTWDHWSTVALFQAHDAGQPVLPLLLAPYNGHYNVLPRALFYGLGLATGWNLRAEAALGFCWVAAALVVLLTMAWRTEPRLLVLAAPFAAVAFSLLQFANFVGGFGMGQLLGTFASLVALDRLTDPRCSRIGFALALLSAAVAFLSHGAAIGLAPAGMVALAFVRTDVRWLRLAAWGTVASLAVGLGVLGGQKTQLVVLWHKLPALTATLVGRLFTIRNDTAPVLAVAAGTLGLAALVGVLAWRIRRDWPQGREAIVRWGSVAVMPVASAVLISVARSAAPLDVVMRSHYVSSTYPFALALLALVAQPLLRPATGASGARKTWARAALAACVVVPVGQQALLARDVLPNLRSGQSIVERNARRLAIGTATDADIAQAFHPVIDLVRTGTEFLRTSDRAWFAHAPAARAPFGRVERVSGRRARARVRLRQGTPWVLEGWALPPLLSREAAVEVVLYVDRTVVARGAPALARADLAADYNTPGPLVAGFALPVADGAQRPPGRYRVRVTASANGRTVPIGEVDVVVLARGKAAPRS